MPARDPDTLSKRLSNFLDRPNPILFVGSGVGRRVGMPDWRGFMEYLASECDRFGDPTSAALIRQRVGRGQFLAAATVYKTCDSIPQGERWKGLAGPFRSTISPGDLNKLEALVGINVTAIVTTNYDHSLHDAHATFKKSWAVPIERGDGSLRGASLRKEFFVARIHGRAELPTSMVVDTQDYRLLEADKDYWDFLLHILSSRSILFLGFSFIDPAIDHILSTYEEKFGPAFEGAA